MCFRGIWQIKYCSNSLQHLLKYLFAVAGYSVMIPLMLKEAKVAISKVGSERKSYAREINLFLSTETYTIRLAFCSSSATGLQLLQGLGVLERWIVWAH